MPLRGYDLVLLGRCTPETYLGELLRWAFEPRTSSLAKQNPHLNSQLSYQQHPNVDHRSNLQFRWQQANVRENYGTQNVNKVKHISHTIHHNSYMWVIIQTMHMINHGIVGLFGSIECWAIGFRCLQEKCPGSAPRHASALGHGDRSVWITKP